MQQCRRILRDAIREMPVLSAQNSVGRSVACAEDDARIVAAMLESMGQMRLMACRISGKKEPELSPKEIKNTTPLLFVSRRVNRCMKLNFLT
uniref:Uncharacterized protein n=1 Tax=Salmonella sp. TaxID=599 RepID=A0A482EVQ8_SALSP|nr:hypothetical protein NNIBIDOC_00206 [Salmonella sp.]